jgi:hypothetical protein
VQNVPEIFELNQAYILNNAVVKNAMLCGGAGWAVF